MRGRSFFYSFSFLSLLRTFTSRQRRTGCIGYMDGPSRSDSVLSCGQARALASIRGNAARHSRAALPQLRARVSALGYTELDLAGAQTP